MNRRSFLSAVGIAALGGCAASGESETTETQNLTYPNESGVDSTPTSYNVTLQGLDYSNVGLSFSLPSEVTVGESYEIVATVDNPDGVDTLVPFGYDLIDTAAAEKLSVSGSPAIDLEEGEKSKTRTITETFGNQHETTILFESTSFLTFGGSGSVEQLREIPVVREEPER